MSGAELQNRALRDFGNYWKNRSEQTGENFEDEMKKDYTTRDSTVIPLTQDNIQSITDNELWGNLDVAGVDDGTSPISYDIFVQDFSAPFTGKIDIQDSSTGQTQTTYLADNEYDSLLSILSENLTALISQYEQKPNAAQKAQFVKDNEDSINNIIFISQQAKASPSLDPKAKQQYIALEENAKKLQSTPENVKIQNELATKSLQQIKAAFQRTVADQKLSDSQKITFYDNLVIRLENMEKTGVDAVATAALKLRVKQESENLKNKLATEGQQIFAEISASVSQISNPQLKKQTQKWIIDSLKSDTGPCLCIDNNLLVKDATGTLQPPSPNDAKLIGSIFPSLTMAYFKFDKSKRDDAVKKFEQQFYVTSKPKLPNNERYNDIEQIRSMNQTAASLNAQFYQDVCELVPVAELQKFFSDVVQLNAIIVATIVFYHSVCRKANEGVGTGSPVYVTDIARDWVQFLKNRPFLYTNLNFDTMAPARWFQIQPYKIIGNLTARPILDGVLTSMVNTAKKIKTECLRHKDKMSKYDKEVDFFAGLVLEFYNKLLAIFYHPAAFSMSMQFDGQVMLDNPLLLVEQCKISRAPITAPVRTTRPQPPLPVQQRQDRPRQLSNLLLANIDNNRPLLRSGAVAGVKDGHRALRPIPIAGVTGLQQLYARISAMAGRPLSTIYAPYFRNNNGLLEEIDTFEDLLNTRGDVYIIMDPDSTGQDGIQFIQDDAGLGPNAVSDVVDSA